MTDTPSMTFGLVSKPKKVYAVIKYPDKIYRVEAKDLKEARRIVAASFDRKYYEPTAERAAWDEAYAKFLALN